MTLLWQALASVILVVAWIVAMAVIGAAITHYGKKKGISAARYRLASKIISGFLLFAAAITLLLVWGIDMRNFGVLMSSVVGLVAIGFFAVWSILSNILSGLFLFISDAFRMEDTITILPENISGKVVDIKLMFVVLQDAEENVLHVPNNVLIQKVIKRAKREGHRTPKEAAQDT